MTYAMALDVEVTTHQKGSPFHPDNFLVTISTKSELWHKYYNIYKDKTLLDKVQEDVDNCSLLVLFNGKFDLHWLRKVGINFANKKIWDCQNYEFLNSNQTIPYPSLDKTAERFGLPLKPDKIKEYWDQGIQTHEIPEQELEEYALHDTEVTWQVYLRQKEELDPRKRTLLSLVNQDLLVLEEMEYNGLAFDRKKSLQMAEENNKKIEELQQSLGAYHNVPNFNWSSNDHLSALLYGGNINDIRKVPDGIYKTGKKAGQVKYKNEPVVYKLPRLYKPLKGSEVKKAGYYSVDEDTLRKLDGEADLVIKILEIKKLEKDNSTYLIGLPKLQDTYGWNEYIHGQFNQCVAATGRLSSSKPNLQNLSEKSQKCFRSRY